MEVKLKNIFIYFVFSIFSTIELFSFDFSDSTLRAWGALPPKPVPSQPIKPTGPLDTPPKSTPISDQAESKVEKFPEQQQSTHDVLPSSSEMSSGSPLVSSLPSTSSSTVSTVVSSSSMHLPSAIVRSSTPAPSPLRKSYTIPELSPPSPHTPISTLNLSETKFEDAATTLATGSTSSLRSPEGSPETSGVPLVVDNDPSVSMTNSPLTSSSLLAPQSPLDRSPLPSTPHDFSEPPTSTQSSPDLSTMSSLPHHVSPVVTQGPLIPPLLHQDVTTPISDFATTAFSSENSQIATNTSNFATLSSSVDEESEQKQLISPLLSSSQDVRLLSSSPQVSPQISGTPPSRIYSSTSSPQSNTEDIPFAGTIADVTSAMDSLQLSLLRSHKKVDDHSDTTSHIEASRIEESQTDTLKKEKEKKEEEENTEEDFSDGRDGLPDTRSTYSESRENSADFKKEVEKDSPQSPPTYSSSSSYKTPTRSSLMVPHTNTVGFGTTTVLDDERTQAGLVLAQSLLEEKENLGLGFQNITSFARENAGGSRVISTPRGTQYMISVNKLERNLHDEERRLLEKEKEEESEYDSESDDGCCCGCCCC